jgi:hypothetical protein
VVQYGLSYSIGIAHDVPRFRLIKTFSFHQRKPAFRFYPQSVKSGSQFIYIKSTFKLSSNLRLASSSVRSRDPQNIIQSCYKRHNLQIQHFSWCTVQWPVYKGMSDFSVSKKSLFLFDGLEEGTFKFSNANKRTTKMAVNMRVNRSIAMIISIRSNNLPVVKQCGKKQTVQLILLTNWTK